MLESEWLLCTEPQRMLEWRQEDGHDSRREYPATVSDRKLRLFADACRERFYGSATNGGTESASEYDSRLRDNGLEPMVSAWCWAAEMCVSQKPVRAAFLRDIVGNPFRAAPSLWPAVMSWAQSLARRAAEDIAQAIYDKRRFENMPVLGDALEDAGCTSEDVLRHCRGEERCPIIPAYVPDNGHTIFCKCRGSGWIPLRSPHVRGCHVLDVIFGWKG